MGLFYRFILVARQETHADGRHDSRTPDVPAMLARVRMVNLAGELADIDVTLAALRAP